MAEEEKSEKEKRIRALTRLYYSKPEVQMALLEFATGREVVPRYFEGFGKRPDSIQYQSDIMGLVNKGATSFHASEEIWDDPLQINSDMSIDELNKIRKSWDLLIDIDSKYLDYSKIALELIIEVLESYGIRNYGIKFSGSKGFHLIVSGNAFPKEFDGKLMREGFPEWPRAICGFIMAEIKPKFNRIVGESDVEALERSTKLTKDQIIEIICPSCGKAAKKGNVVKFKCPICGDSVERRNYQITKKRLKCTNDRCPGIFEMVDQEDIYFCEGCKIYDISHKDRIEEESTGHIVYSQYAKEQNNFEGEFDVGLKEKHRGGLDLVLVAPRHLFRMPYSLHEKTALASVVIEKSQIKDFSPRDADAMKVKIKNYMPANEQDEGRRLLATALGWKKEMDQKDEKKSEERYKDMKTDFVPVDFSGVTYAIYPKPIKKLLKGLKDGKKRGLFVLMTFLRTIGKSPDEINTTIREWNKLNEPPLKEGYVKSQLDWLFRQKKQILPPNYINDSFYKDLGLIEGKQENKNPVVDVMKAMSRRS